MEQVSTQKWYAQIQKDALKLSRGLMRLTILLMLTLVTGLFAEPRYSLTGVVSPEDIKRAAAAVPKLRSMMRDGGESFVLKSVRIGIMVDRKHPERHFPNCFKFRSRNGYGGYDDTGSASLEWYGDLGTSVA